MQKTLEERFLFHVYRRKVKSKIYFCFYCKTMRNIRINLKYRRIYFNKCNHYFNPLKGTIFYKSKIKIWRIHEFLRLYSTKQLTYKMSAKILNISRSRAGQILIKIRKLIDQEHFKPEGVIQIDDLYFGPPAKYKRKQRYTKKEVQSIKEIWPNYKFTKRRKTYKEKALTMGLASENSKYLLIDTGLRVQGKIDHIKKYIQFGDESTIKEKNSNLPKEKYYPNYIRTIWLYMWNQLIEKYAKNHTFFCDGDRDILRLINENNAKHEVVLHSRNKFVKLKNNRIVTINAIEGIFGRFSREFRGIHVKGRKYFQTFLNDVSKRNSKELTYYYLYNKIFI